MHLRVVGLRLEGSFVLLCFCYLCELFISNFLYFYFDDTAVRSDRRILAPDLGGQ